MNIVLFEPEIPSNTGNIGRTCVATGSKLHLIEPLGFMLDERSLKRAGMDYWGDLELYRYVDFDDFLEKNKDARLVMASTKGYHNYSDFEFHENDFIVFGKESAGIPEEILIEHPDTTIRIPMMGESRSLNLSNSVAIVLYEALRQTGFKGFKTEGELHHLHWRDR